MGRDDAAAASGVALGLFPGVDVDAEADASSGKNVLKTPLCCQA